jgi:hypothetical protein
MHQQLTRFSSFLISQSLLTDEKVCVFHTSLLLVRPGPDRHIDPYFCPEACPSDLSDFPLANSCGIGTYVFEIIICPNNLRLIIYAD